MSAVEGVKTVDPEAAVGVELVAIAASPDPPEAVIGTSEPEKEQDISLNPIEEGTSTAPAGWLSRFSYRMLSSSGSSKKDDVSNIPDLSYWQVFTTFLWFGCRAFGGPVAQIALMKQELVTEAKWISNERFMRVYSVYQILPGPEAMELACYFGYISKGRIGSVLGGLGFLLPGFCLMLLLSYIYVEFGLSNAYVQKSFTAIQCAIAAIIFRATYKLSEGALTYNNKKAFHWQKGYLCLLCFICSALRINFFLSLGVSGIINAVFENKHKVAFIERFKYPLAGLASAMLIGFYILYVALNGFPSESMVGGSNSSVSGTSYRSLMELGLIAGLVTFGGAYTTLPFIYSATVSAGGWLTQKEFLDALAITNMLPTPLVTFVTMVGYVGHGIGGAIIMTIGIFLPAFSFTLIGHEVFESIVDNDFIEPFLDGVGAAVIGLLLQVAFQFVQSVILQPVDAVAFLLAFVAVFYFTDKYTQPIVLIVAAIAGQSLYA